MWESDQSADDRRSSGRGKGREDGMEEVCGRGVW